VFVESTLATEAERRYRFAIGVAMAK